jgi:gamma-glutamylcyclotransferase (GGCT)/AIG2-like uncharacterized protein YtfP
VPQYLFAYGTLQPGLAPVAIRSVVDRLTPVGRGTTPGALFDLAAYPGAVFSAGGIVRGVVYRLPIGGESAVLAALDAYEGCPDLYIRMEVAVTLSDDRRLDCWAYQYNQDLTGRRPIASGTYVPEPKP